MSTHREAIRFINSQRQSRRARMSHDSADFGENYHWEHNTSNTLALYQGWTEVARFSPSEARAMIQYATLLLDLYNPKDEEP